MQRFCTVMLVAVSACSFPQLPYGRCKFGTGSADCRPGLTCQPDGTCAKPCEPPASVACIHPLSASVADSGVFVCLADGGWNSNCEFPACDFASGVGCATGFSCQPSGSCGLPCQGSATLPCTLPNGGPGSGVYRCEPGGTWNRTCGFASCDFPTTPSACPANQFCRPDGGCTTAACLSSAECTVPVLEVPGQYQCGDAGDLSRSCSVKPCTGPSECGSSFRCLGDGGCGRRACVGNQTERCPLDGGSGESFEGEAVCIAGFFEPCAPTAATQCRKTQGVCAGKSRRYGDSQACTALSYGSNYLPIEPCPANGDGGDGLDNDCDGLTDEIDVGEGGVRLCGFGPCATTLADGGPREYLRCGQERCTVASLASAYADAGYAQTEVCGDGIDNDCDGNIDVERPLSLAANIDEVAAASGGLDVIYPYRLAVSRQGASGAATGDLIKFSMDGGRSSLYSWTTDAGPSKPSFVSQPDGVLLTHLLNPSVSRQYLTLSGNGTPGQFDTSFSDAGALVGGPQCMMFSGNNTLMAFQFNGFLPDAGMIVATRVEPLNWLTRLALTECPAPNNAIVTADGGGVCVSSVVDPVAWSNGSSAGIIAHQSGWIALGPKSRLQDGGLCPTPLTFGDYCVDLYADNAPGIVYEVRAAGTDAARLMMRPKNLLLVVTAGQGFTSPVTFSFGPFPHPVRGTAIAAAPTDAGTSVLISYLLQQNLYLKALLRDGGSNSDRMLTGANLVVDGGSSLAWSEAMPDRALLLVSERLLDGGTHAVGRLVCMPPPSLPY